MVSQRRGALIGLMTCRRLRKQGGRWKQQRRPGHARSAPQPKSTLSYLAGTWGAERACRKQCKTTDVPSAGGPLPSPQCTNDLNV